MFEASANRIFTLRDLSRSGAPKYEEHEVIGQKPVLEFVAPGLDTITFNIRLDRFYGVIPEREIDRIRRSRDLGHILPLTIGGKYLGDWVITNTTEVSKNMDGSGRVIIAELSITLKEVRQ